LFIQKGAFEPPLGPAQAEANGGNIIFPSSLAERLRRRLCNKKIAGSNPASGHLATPFRKEI